MKETRWTCVLTKNGKVLLNAYLNSTEVDLQLSRLFEAVNVPTKPAKFTMLNTENEINVDVIDDMDNYHFTGKRGVKG